VRVVGRSFARTLRPKCRHDQIGNVCWLFQHTRLRELLTRAGDADTVPGWASLSLWIACLFVGSLLRIASEYPHASCCGPGARVCGRA
jgi:hypothetical protein